MARSLLASNAAACISSTNYHVYAMCSQVPHSARHQKPLTLKLVAGTASIHPRLANMPSVDQYSGMDSHHRTLLPCPADGVERSGSASFLRRPGTGRRKSSIPWRSPYDASKLYTQAVQPLIVVLIWVVCPIQHLPWAPEHVQIIARVSYLKCIVYRLHAACHAYTATSYKAVACLLSRTAWPAADACLDTNLPSIYLTILLDHAQASQPCIQYPLICLH